MLGDAGGAEQVAGAALQALEKHNPKLMRTPFVTGGPKTLRLGPARLPSLWKGPLDGYKICPSLCGNQPVRRVHDSEHPPAELDRRSCTSGPPRHRAGVASVEDGR